MLADDLSEALKKYDPADPRYATEVVDRVLSAARAQRRQRRALPAGAPGLELTWRIDGVLLRA